MSYEPILEKAKEVIESSTMPKGSLLIKPYRKYGKSMIQAWADPKISFSTTSVIVSTHTVMYMVESLDWIANIFSMTEEEEFLLSDDQKIVVDYIVGVTKTEYTAIIGLREEM